MVDQSSLNNSKETTKEVENDPKWKKPKIGATDAAIFHGTMIMMEEGLLIKWCWVFLWTKKLTGNNG